jgi:hypothetical protein
VRIACCVFKYSIDRARLEFVVVEAACLSPPPKLVIADPVQPTKKPA